MMQLLSATTKPPVEDDVNTSLTIIAVWLVTSIILFATLKVWRGERYDDTLNELFALLWPLILAVMPFYLFYKLIFNVNKRIKDYFDRKP